MRHARAGEAKVRAGFTRAVDRYAHHVGIVEAVHARVSPKVFHRGNALDHTDTAAFSLPAVARVVGGAPSSGTRRRTPFPRFAHTPFAHIEEDVATRSFERIAHRFVALLSRNGIAGSTAIVIFQEVDTPFGVLLGIDRFVAIRTVGAGARFGSCIRIDTELQPLVVHIFYGSPHSDREFRRIFLRGSVTVALGSVPKVVDDDEVVTGIAQSQIHHIVGNCFYDLSRNLVLYHIPRNPAHHRFRLYQISAHRHRSGESLRISVGRH